MARRKKKAASTNTTPQTVPSDEWADPVGVIAIVPFFIDFMECDKDGSQKDVRTVNPEAIIDISSHCTFKKGSRKVTKITTVRGVFYSVERREDILKKIGQCRVEGFNRPGIMAEGRYDVQSNQ